MNHLRDRIELAAIRDQMQMEKLTRASALKRAGKAQYGARDLVESQIWWAHQTGEELSPLEVY